MGAFTRSYQIKEYIGIRKYLLVDFYLQDYNTIIEYNGRQHYEPVNFGNMSREESVIKLKEQIERDEWLRQYCKHNNISLIEVDSREMNNIDKIKTYLQSKLLPLLVSPDPV